MKLSGKSVRSPEHVVFQAYTPASAGTDDQACRQLAPPCIAQFQFAQSRRLGIIDCLRPDPGSLFHFLIQIRSVQGMEPGRRITSHHIVSVNQPGTAYPDSFNIRPCRNILTQVIEELTCGRTCQRRNLVVTGHPIIRIYQTIFNKCPSYIHGQRSVFIHLLPPFPPRYSGCTPGTNRNCLFCTSFCFLYLLHPRLHRSRHSAYSSQSYRRR